MKERARELKLDADRANGEAELLARIAEMPESDRKMAQRFHEIVMATEPALSPRTWYGMPAYALEEKVICFFQSAHKFKSRYATFGFSDKAKLDDGTMWPVSYALTELDAAAGERIAGLVRDAVS